MNEKSLTILEQYDIEVKGTYRIKGTYGCDTISDRLILQEYNNSEEKMQNLDCMYQCLLKKNIATDYAIKNKEGNFVSISVDRNSYILKKWYIYKECDITNKENVISAARTLATFHNATSNTVNIWGDLKGFHPGENFLNVFKRHNQEIIKIRNYIKKRKNKTVFELVLQNEMDYFYLQGIEALEQLQGKKYITYYENALKNKSICHGNYTHHNLILGEEDVAIINFRKVCFDLQLRDFYDFLRKVMEKNNWDLELAEKVITTYSEIRELTETDLAILKAMFSYPEKFWKIVNYYFNTNKAWTSEKNEEKLKQFQNQEQKRWAFIANL